MTDHCGRQKRDGSGDECRLPAGWGTDHPGEGACKHHGGNAGGARDGAGAPENNGNAEKHALQADPKKYHERQSEAEQTWIFELTEVICDRIRAQRGSVDPLDRVLARRIAIKLHIVANATEYIDQEGLLQTIQVEKNGASYEKDIPNGLLDELRQYDREVWNELKKLGILDDPESQQADAAEGLISVLSGVNDEC